MREINFTYRDSRESDTREVALFMSCKVLRDQVSAHIQCDMPGTRSSEDLELHFKAHIILETQ